MSSPDIVTISTDIGDASSFPTLATVGTVHEVAINGVGYMLADNPEKDIAWRRGTIELSPERLATSETPFSQAIERYSFDPKSADWSGGAGQRYANRERSVADRYWDSEGLDPFTRPGQLTGLHLIDDIEITANAGKAVIVGSDLYFRTGNAQLTRYSNFSTKVGDISSIEDTTGAVPSLNSLASDGQFWYAATTQSVIRGTTSNPGADWSAQDAYQVEWAGGRIMAAVKTGSSSTPNVFTSLAPDGTEENTGGHYDAGENKTILLGQGTDQGYYFFGSYAGNVGQIHSWQLGLDENSSFFVPKVAWDMPTGVVPRAIYAHSGSVFIRGWEPDSNRAVIYRAVHDGSGYITPFVIVDLVGSANEQGAFAAIGDNLLFSWQSMAESGVYSGVGAINLISGGYCKWLYPQFDAAKNGAVITSILSWRGAVVLSVAGGGVFFEDVSKFVPSGWLETSIADGASILAKVFDDVDIVTDPLLATESVEIKYSVNGGGSFISAGTFNTVSGVRDQFPVAVKAADLALRYYLTGSSTSFPVVRFAQARYHPLGLADTILVLPIDCSDVLSDVKGHPLPENGPGAGVRRARSLEGLSQTRVLVQDIDYPSLGLAEQFEVLSVESKSTGVFDRSQGFKRWSLVSIVTLRKVGSG